jgi:hypothetical protein
VATAGCPRHDDRSGGLLPQDACADVVVEFDDVVADAVQWGLSERRLASDLNSIGLRPIFQTRFAERPDVLDGDAVVQRVVGG